MPIRGVTLDRWLRQAEYQIRSPRIIHPGARGAESLHRSAAEPALLVFNYYVYIHQAENLMLLVGATRVEANVLKKKKERKKSTEEAHVAGWIT